MRGVDYIARRKRGKVASSASIALRVFRKITRGIFDDASMLACIRLSGSRRKRNENVRI
jgi:hypothetical protein